MSHLRGLQVPACLLGQRLSKVLLSRGFSWESSRQESFRQGTHGPVQRDKGTYQGSHKGLPAG